MHENAHGEESEGTKPEVKLRLFTWWDYQDSRYPQLARYAPRVLFRPGSSVSCERLFSASGRVLSKIKSNDYRKSSFEPLLADLIQMAWHNVSFQKN